MTASVAQGSGALPSLVGRLCDWSEQGSGAQSGQWGSVFWATQPGGYGTVRVYLSSPRRVLLDASQALLGTLSPDAEPTFGVVQEWLDPQSTWPSCAWSDALIAAAGQRARDAGWSAAVPPSRPRSGQPLSLDWLRIILWATYHTVTFDPRELFMSRTSTMPREGTEWLVNPARQRTAVFEVEALDPAIRGVFDLTSDTTDPASRPSSSSSSSGKTVLAIAVGALLLMGSKRR